MKIFRSVMGAAGAAAMFLGAAACSSASKEKTAMEASPRVPAAEAVVQTQDAGNNNTALDIQVHHLAPVQKVASDATSYVVWVQPTDGSPARNVGALTVDQNLDGRLRTVTPYRAMRVFITPESVATASYPNGEQILSTTIQ